MNRSANSPQRCTAMANTNTRSKSSETDNSGSPTTCTRTPPGLTSGLTDFLTPVSPPLPRPIFPNLPELMLFALLTHSKYLRREWWQMGDGQQRALRQIEMLRTVQNLTMSSAASQ